MLLIMSFGGLLGIVLSVLVVTSEWFERWLMRRIKESDSDDD